MTVAAGKKYVNVYIGNGIFYENKSYSPPVPGVIQNEWMPVKDEEEGESEMSLKENDDVREDPIVPVPEGEEGDEDQ